MCETNQLVNPPLPGRNATEPPPDLTRYRPRNGVGLLYLAISLTLTVAAVGMSLRPELGWWLAGQVLLAFALLQWFAVLHEAGHRTLFRSRRLNLWTSHLAGFLALIPGDCWRIVHAKHHYWTGWQDLDLTTQSLVPRPLRRIERWVINLCWALWIPLFSTLYRLNNYWNLPRLWQLFPGARDRRVIVLNIIVYASLYALIVWWFPWRLVARTLASALLLSFAIQDLLILSQHTHIPMKIAAGKQVAPFSPGRQDVFTRSLIFPKFFSRWILLNMDAHSLHHMYPSIPGYDLHRVKRVIANETPWWLWVWKARSLRGDVLLFQNRDQTGFYF